MLRTATCCCGQASIEADGDPDIHLVSFCNNCKKRTGSAFSMSAYFQNAKIKSTKGDLTVYKINNDFTEQKRYFCSVCGTTLFWNIFKFDGVPDTSEMTGIASGCFINNPLPEPSIMSYSAGKCAWLELPKMTKAGPAE